MGQLRLLILKYNLVSKGESQSDLTSSGSIEDGLLLVAVELSQDETSALEEFRQYLDRTKIGERDEYGSLCSLGRPCHAKKAA